eukprot:37692-Prorocentrum_minimum.AAC.3
MPSGCRPSARTAFIFHGGGDPAPRRDFERTLDGTAPPPPPEHHAAPHRTASHRIAPRRAILRVA